MQHGDDAMRKNDVLVGEMVGTLKQFFERYEIDQKQHKENYLESREWRKNVEERFKNIEEFLNEIRAPHKLFLFLLRALMIAAVGGFITFSINYIKAHWQ